MEGYSAEFYSKHDLELKLKELEERNKIQIDIINGKYKKPSDEAKNIYIAELKKDIEKLKSDIIRTRAEKDYFAVLEQRFEYSVKDLFKRITKILVSQNRQPAIKRKRRLGPACRYFHG